MSEEFKKLNEKFNDDTYPIFPFIAPNRITPLRAGFWRKHKAKLRWAIFEVITESKDGNLGRGGR